MESFIAKKSQRISKLVAESVDGLSYGALMKLLRNKEVKVNGKRVNKDILINEGDEVCLYFVKEPFYTEVYKDENVLVINKKSGFESEAVFNQIKEKFIGAKFVHRLDRNTYGLMIFALNEIAEKELLSGFKNRTFDKKYLAVVIGKMPKKEDVLCDYLLKDKDKALVKIYQKAVNGSVAIKTGYKVLDYNQKNSLLEITLFTGKTHQIRAHLAYIGHPIIGDGKYGDKNVNKEYGKSTQMLCAYKFILHFKKESPLLYLDGKTFLLGEELCPKTLLP